MITGETGVNCPTWPRTSCVAEGSANDPFWLYLYGVIMVLTSPCFLDHEKYRGVPLFSEQMEEASEEQDKNTERPWTKMTNQGLTKPKSRNLGWFLCCKKSLCSDQLTRLWCCCARWNSWALWKTVRPSGWGFARWGGWRRGKWRPGRAQPAYRGRRGEATSWSSDRRYRRGQQTILHVSEPFRLSRVHAIESPEGGLVRVVQLRLQSQNVIAVTLDMAFVLTRKGNLTFGHNFADHETFPHQTVRESQY